MANAFDQFDRNPFDDFDQTPVGSSPSVSNKPSVNVGQLLQQFEAAQGAGDFQRADEIRQQMNQLQSDRIGGALEAGRTIASGAVVEPIAGLSGIAAMVPGGQTPTEAIESTREALTIQPSTPEGMQALEAAGEIAEKLPDVAGKAGEIVFDITGSPTLAASTQGVVTVLPELIGLGALRKLRVGTQLIDDAGQPTKALRKALDDKGLVFENLTDEARAKIPKVADQSFISGQSIVPQSANDALVEQIKSGGRDDALAGLRVVNNKVDVDPLGTAALNQGYQPGFVQSVKTSTPETKAQMRKMLNIARRIKNQERVGLDTRPGDIVGDAVSKRLQYLKESANMARKELNEITKKRLNNKTINPQLVREPLTEALDNLEVNLLEGSKGRPVVDFTGSILSKNRPAQKAINDAIDLLYEAQQSGFVSARRAHILKRQLDDLIDFKKKSAAGLSESGRNVLKSVRAGLNNAIREVDGDYARVNDTLSRSLTALDDFDKASGASIDIFGEGANKAFGTKMRGLMSNIQGRVNLENAINQLDDTVLELRDPGRQLMVRGESGIRKPAPININDDIKDLTMFANALDARFGNVAKTGFSGQLEQAINRVLNQGIAQEVIQQGAGIAGRAANKLQGINEFNAFETLDDLLKATK